MSKITRKIRNKAAALLTCLLLPLAAMSQSAVTGRVTDKASGEPLPGVTILERGTLNGTTTDADGHYSLILRKQTALLRFSMIGMGTQVLMAHQGERLNVRLGADVQQLDQVVVTGYMSEKKADLTGAVTVVKMKDVADIPTGNVMASLQSRVPGVNITTDGTPGGMNTSVLVRGVTTINDSSPLYVIDGVMTRDNIASILSSDDIASIQVLKDAASAAIYGAQAANGVIIITTKHAREGQTRVNFDMSLSAQTFVSGIHLLNTQQWGDCYWQAYKYSYGTTPNSAVYGNGPEAVPQEYYYDANGIKIKTGNTNWPDEIFSTALMQNYNVTLANGSKHGSTTLSLNYMDQDGLCRNTDFKRFNTRIATDYHFLNNHLRIGESAAINRWTQHLQPDGIEEEAIAQHPAVPLYDEEGDYAGGYIDILGDKPNMIRLTDNEKNNRHEYWRVFGNSYIEIEPIRDLVFKSNFGVNYYNEFNSVFVPAWQEGSRSVSTNSLSTNTNHTLSWIWSNTANYRFKFGKNTFSALLGMEAKKDHTETLSGYGTGFAVEDVDYRYLDAATAGQTVGGNASNYSMVSYFGKINYAFNEK
ncbi:MAG: SusC/RagA family TonB-linked outer membrane protein, partial [Tannerella sp.]|nr:SusC/RagA family TonB-linked outer membrane protein [Tannerella sp.]